MCERSLDKCGETRRKKVKIKINSELRFGWRLSPNLRVRLFYFVSHFAGRKEKKFRQHNKRRRPVWSSLEQQ